MTKVLVGLGLSSDGNGTEFEVIDLESITNVCENIVPFPVIVAGAVGGLGLDGRPLICGGFDNPNCYSYDYNGWIQTFTMIQPKRDFSAASKSPYPYTSLLVTGGYIPGQIIHDSSEVLTQTGWIQTPSMPAALENHCMVKVNTTTVMIIGGYSNSSSSPSTFYFNVDSETWIEGPPLNIARRFHSCGLIRKTGKSSIIVIGGITNYVYLQSVEILDDGSTQWRYGPDFKFGICGTKLIEGISATIFTFFDRHIP